VSTTTTHYCCIGYAPCLYPLPTALCLDQNVIKFALMPKQCEHHRLSHLRSQCGTVPLADMLKANRLRWLGHVIRMGSERLPKQALLSRLHGVCSVRPGRPPRSWEECIKHVLVDLGLPLPMHDLSDHCAIRGSWLSMVYRITHPNAGSRPFHRSQASHQQHMAHMQPPAVLLSWLLARQSMRAMSDQLRLAGPHSFFLCSWFGVGPTCGIMIYLAVTG